MKKGVLKNYFIAITLLLLLGITFGYALLNSTLTINGKSNISKNTWDVHFDNIVVKDGSVEAIKLPTIENNTTIDFEVTLNLPGDFYEFTVDVVNDGSIDAMIDSIEKTPTLTTEQQKYLNYIIEYENGEEVTTKQLVKKESFVRLKVKVELRKDVLSTDLPQNTETLDLRFIANYVQADNSGIQVKDDGVGKFKIGNILSIGTEQFYIIGTEGNNVKLLARYNLYVGGCYDNRVRTAYGAEATGMQDENMKGFYNFDTPSNGISDFSDYNIHGKVYSDYSGSIVEGYVNNYKTLLKNKFNVNIIEARLITKEELISEEIGCDESLFTCTTSKYEWIYSTGYWTQSSFSEDDIWAVFYYHGNLIDVLYSSNSLGVRPVIVVSKSYFE